MTDKNQYPKIMISGNSCYRESEEIEKKESEESEESEEIEKKENKKSESEEESEEEIESETIKNLRKTLFCDKIAQEQRYFFGGWCKAFRCTIDAVAWSEYCHYCIHDLDYD